MRGTSDIPITMLRMFLLRRGNRLDDMTSAERREFTHLATNSLGPWFSEILTPLRSKYDQVRRVVDPHNEGMDDWCHGKSSGNYVWAGFPQKHKRGSSGTVFGANAGVTSSSIVIGFAIHTEYVFKETFMSDSFLSWCYSRIPRIEQHLDEILLRTEELRESR